MATRSAGFRFHENVHGVYFDDLDALHILHNARYLLLVERTIGSFLVRLGWSGTHALEQKPEQVHLVRANTIEYERPVTGTGEVRVRVWVEKLGTTSLVFGFAVLPMDEDADVAHGTRVIVSVDAQTRAPVPWSEHSRQQIEPFLRRSGA